ncbi:MAG TPA: hypothetical protein VH142_00460 [Polyangiaceae bacterium]|nr:hypothetical protein [Polyangiaceae bacterium]
MPPLSNRSCSMTPESVGCTLSGGNTDQKQKRANFFMTSSFLCG